MTQHVKGQIWFSVALDFSIVVFGVFVGLQVSNWNSTRIAHEAGETYRTRIIKDLVNNEVDLNGRTAYFGQVKAFGLRVLGDLNGTARISDESFDRGPSGDANIHAAHEPLHV